MRKINKQNLLLFLSIMSISIIVTFPTFTITHGLDSYANMFKGYDGTALWFLQNGRLFTAFFFWLFGIIHLPFDSISFISAFFANLFLSLSILKLYDRICMNLSLKQTIQKGLLLMSIFFLFYQPLMIELFLVDETFVMAFGILCTVFAVDYISKKNRKDSVIGGLYFTIGVICYQGVACYFFPLLFILLMSKLHKNDKKEIMDIVKAIGIAILVYITAFVMNLLVIKIVEFITGSVSAKIGSFNLIDNFVYIMTTLLPNSLKELFHFMNPKIYYGFTILVFVILMIGVIKRPHKKINIALLLVLILSTILSPFIPNLVMSSEQNYTAARMCLTLATIPSIFILFMMSRNLLKERYCIYGILIMISILGFYYTRTIIGNTKIDLKRYKYDVTYLKQIYAELDYYQNKHDKTIKTVYYAKDTDVAYYYNFGHNNGASVRLAAVDWAMENAFQYYSGNKYQYKPMSKEKYEEYFKDKNYNDFSPKQFVYEGNTAYVLIY